MQAYFSRILLLAIFVGIAASCASTRAVSENSEPPRIIVRFVETVSDPGSVEFVRDLNQKSGAEFKHVRRLGTGAHLYVAQGNHVDLESILSRLRAWEAVIYAEADKRVKANPDFAQGREL